MGVGRRACAGSGRVCRTLLLSTLLLAVLLLPMLLLGVFHDVAGPCAV
jgi:hypothetical protein